MSEDLEAALARAAAIHSRAASLEHRRPLEPIWLAALAEAAEVDSDEARLLAERARCGRPDWDDLWSDPWRHGEAAVRVVRTAIVTVVGEMPITLSG